MKLLTVVIFMITCLAGCSKELEKTEVMLQNGQILTTVGKCVVTECISKINTESSYDEVKEIIGIDPTEKDDKNGIYTWQLSETTSFTAVFDEGAQFQINLDKNILADKRFTLEKYSELKQEKDGDGLTYKEMKERVGGYDGAIINKNQYTTTYYWTDGEGEFIEAIFVNGMDKCLVYLSSKAGQ